MKALYVLNENEPIMLAVGDIPVPVPSENQLLIRVSAAGVTQTELLWYPTTHTKEGHARAKAIPGHEFSGVVAAVGRNVFGFAVGDEVYGVNDWFEQGATAEFCLAQPTGIALKPAKLSHKGAAAIPISALTAWQGLFVRGKLKAGERLLVHGGAGAVGIFVIQLAKLHGADVIATCSGKNIEFVRSLKADEIIDYETTRFEDVVTEVDMVFDTVGGDTLERSWPLLNAGGRIVTIASDAEATENSRTKAAFFIVEPDHQQLVDLGALLDAGYLRAFAGQASSIQDAADAYRKPVSRGTGHGKAVIVMSKEK